MICINMYRTIEAKVPGILLMVALTLFTIALSKKVKEKGIIVNAADPGIVSTKLITMHMWFDPLTDIFFVEKYAWRGIVPAPE